MDTDNKATQEIERKYDQQLAFRAVGPVMAAIVTTILVVMVVYHYYASGFGLLREMVHRGVHLSFVLGLVFLLFGSKRSLSDKPAPERWYRWQGIPLWDYALAIVAVIAAMYLPLLPDDVVVERVGNPSTLDMVMGTGFLVLVLEATRRSVSWALALIAVIFVLYALFGRYAPGALIHAGASWTAVINQLYMTNQGIYGIAIGVMAKYVFLFVVFGVLATRIGLGQLFIDLASVVAGRFSGGPAKVAIFSSAMLGTISGSSIANTVTTGSLTIPAMKKVGYEPHFAAAVEATSSTGGQITPPVMGAAAFIMAEFLEIPYREILVAALFPALLHYFGIFIMVHLKARRLNLRGISPEDLPRVMTVLKKHWLTLFPLILLIYLIVSGRTPDYAAVMGISACVGVGIISPVNRLTFRDLANTLAKGAKYSLSVGAAAAAVGIIVGVVTLTGSGFRLGAVVTQTGADIGTLFDNLPWIGPHLSEHGTGLFFTLVLTAAACIIMGAGIPTTATYIILASIAAPALSLLNVQPLVAHFFVFYYGVLADITPPVALAAYAGSGIAGSNPFKTGNTAFRLGIAKALVPFVFVFSPALLIITPEFTITSFLITLLGAMLGIGVLGASFSGFLLTPLPRLQRWYIGFVSLLFISPGLPTMVTGLVLLAPVLVAQILQLRKKADQAAYPLA